MREPARIEPLSVAKVEIMTPTAMNAPPALPRKRRAASDATVLGAQNLGSGQHVKVSEVHQDINDEHQQRPANQRQRACCAGDS